MLDAAQEAVIASLPIDSQRAVRDALRAAHELEQAKAPVPAEVPESPALVVEPKFKADEAQLAAEHAFLQAILAPKE